MKTSLSFLATLALICGLLRPPGRVGTGNAAARLRAAISEVFK